jgi:hypothetical protein
LVPAVGSFEGKKKLYVVWGKGRERGREARYQQNDTLKLYKFNT